MTDSAAKVRILSYNPKNRTIPGDLLTLPNEKIFHQHNLGSCPAASVIRGESPVLHGRGRPGLQEVVQHRERELPHHLPARAGFAGTGLCTRDGALPEAGGTDFRLSAGRIREGEDACRAACIQLGVKRFGGLGAEENGRIHASAGLWRGGDSVGFAAGGARVPPHQSDAVRAEPRAETFQLVLRRDVERTDGRNLHGHLPA